MKSRKETARFIEWQLHDLDYEKPIKTQVKSYGYQELKQLMDFIWERNPTETERIATYKEYKNRKEL